ncbi:MAG: hypothetical protein CVV24_11550 [Ignavibacteriae bacterium HGW-Ignavibacteriae-3]|nr:MAG: hypothetical protein CVV24_11550 [Ignavibacteriae bacterium HGW-Ignavibacteriae-3]
MKKISLLSLFILASGLLSAQGTGGTNAKFEYRSLIDLPTAGVLSKGYAGVSVDVMPFGVVITKIEVGVFEGFSFGISYGGTNIIGTGSIEWYKLPAINVRARIINETEALPALSIGFDSQGKGKYDKYLERFLIKSPGFFAAAAKNFEFLGYLSIHALVNYSLERQDGDKDLNLGVGVEKTIGDKVSLIGEYDFAVNDNTGSALGKGNGYFNLGLRWSVGDGLTLGIDLRDLLQNNRFVGHSADRGIFVEYLKALF